jgi:hypothetical protein
MILKLATSQQVEGFCYGAQHSHEMEQALPRGMRLTWGVSDKGNKFEVTAFFNAYDSDLNQDREGCEMGFTVLKSESLRKLNKEILDIMIALCDLTTEEAA